MCRVFAGVISRLPKRVLIHRLIPEQIKLDCLLLKQHEVGFDSSKKESGLRDNGEFYLICISAIFISCQPF